VIAGPFHPCIKPHPPCSQGRSRPSAHHDPPKSPPGTHVLGGLPVVSHWPWRRLGYCQQEMMSREECDWEWEWWMSVSGGWGMEWE